MFHSEIEVMLLVSALVIRARMVGKMMTDTVSSKGKLKAFLPFVRYKRLVFLASEFSENIVVVFKILT